MGKPKDVTGVRFGRLVAKYVARLTARNARIWHCDCDCGNSVDVIIGSLTSGNTKSCGCFSRDQAASTGRKRTTHGRRARADGQGNDRTYRAWVAMRQRCNKKDAQAYDRYGGRGIVVCDQWGSFDVFLKDMGECPAGLTLERKDNDKGYNPENCIWADYSAQNRNKRGVKLSQEAASKIRADMRKNEAIAKSYGVSRRLIGQVKAGKIWA